MTKGLITITFDYGVTYAAEISVDGDEIDLHNHKQWNRIKLWLLVESSDILVVAWDDGSEVVLNRSKIVNINMRPFAKPLEIL